MRIIKQIVWQIIIVFVMIIFQSCIEDLDPITPSSERPVYEGSGMVGSGGAIVQVTTQNSPIKGAYVDIPEGALSDNVLINVVQSINPAPNDNDAIVIKLEPAGLTFNKPIKIGLPYKSSVSDPYSLQAYYYLKDSLIIEEIPIDSIDVNNKLIIATTTHFSEFYSGIHSVFAEIEMLSIGGKLGAKLKLYGKNSQGIPVSFKYGIPLNLDFILSNGIFYAGQAFEEYFNALGLKLHSTFYVSLKEESFFIDPIVSSKSLFIKREEVLNDTPNERQIITFWDRKTSGNTKILTTKWLTEENQRQKFYSGEPLIFRFDDFTPNPNKKYYVEVEWATALHPDAFYLGRISPIYRFNNYSEKEKISDMTVSNLDLDNNCLEDLFQQQVMSTNTPPNAPALISPANNSTNNSINSELNWSCSDPDGDPLNYDIYFGTLTNPPLIQSSYSSTTYNPGNLSNNTKYYWKVKAKDNQGNLTDGLVWNFTTAGGGTPPTVTTSSISYITSNSANGGGNVTAQGGSTIISRGVCWSTSQNPTTSNSKSTDGTGTGNFTSSISGLSPSTPYYVRAYATNSTGTSYGNQVSFITTSGVAGEPVAWYPFNGTCDDSTGNGYDGTNHNATFVADRFSSPNKAMHFSGGNSSYITTSNTSNIVLNDSFSVSFWIKFENEGMIIDRDIVGTYSTDWNIQCDAAGKLGFEFGSTAILWSNQNVKDSNWHLIVFLRNRTTGILKFYIDGNLDKQVTNQTNDLIGTANINIGAWENQSFNDGFTGSLDDIRFYKRELSESEIQILYSGGL